MKNCQGMDQTKQASLSELLALLKSLMGKGAFPSNLLDSIFEHGVTTKRVDPMEHGVGLALTRLVCRRRGGEITVEREAGATSFVARLGVSSIAESVAAEAFS